MCPVNLLCPHCGHEELVEPEVMDDDERRCNYCGLLVFDEEDTEHHINCSECTNIAEDDGCHNCHQNNGIDPNQYPIIKRGI